MYANLLKFIEMGAHLSPYAMKPVLDCTSEEGYGPGFRFGATTMQGWRKNQEDTFKCDVKQLTNDQYQYFAVFDGHGGSEVAKYLQNKLHNDIRAFLESEDPELALQLGFLTCDASLRDPAGMQELNEIVEAENAVSVAGIEKNRKAFFARLNNFNSGFNQDGAGCSHDNADFSIEKVGCSSAETDSSKETTIDKEKADKSEDNESPEDVETMSIDEPVPGNSSNLDDSGVHQDNEDNGQMDTLHYLLNDDLAPESSDPEDEDFDLEDEEVSSDSGDEDTFEDMENMEPGVHSGSTGTVLLIGPKQYYCANVGDSRCVMCRGGKAVDMSLDHKPDDPEELKRINATGSVVSDGRINKSLNLSRAFGDFYYKDSDLAPFEQCVTVEPTIHTFPVEDDDEFIILASDGIWNSMSSQEVVDFVRLRLKETDNLSVIGEELFRLILAPDTEGDGTGCDNMTFILIQLDPVKIRCNAYSKNVSSSGGDSNPNQPSGSGESNSKLPCSTEEKQPDPQTNCGDSNSEQTS